MRFLHGYGHPLWCASPPGWWFPFPVRFPGGVAGQYQPVCPGGSPAAARRCASVMGPGWVQQPRMVRFWQGPRPGAYGTLPADRLAGPRIGALQLPAPHACARSALQKTILEQVCFYHLEDPGPRRGHFSNCQIILAH